MAKHKPTRRRLSRSPSSAQRSPTWGQVEIREDSDHKPLIHIHRREQVASTHLCVWCPDGALKENVPEGAVVILRCEHALDGERRFSPIGTGTRGSDPFWPFYAYAFSCGLAILCKVKQAEMTKEHRRSYRLMWFLFQRAQKMRQHIRRAFNFKKDLIIRRTGRRSKDITEMHVLPWTFDKSTKKMGYPQSVDELLARGQEAARQAGVSRPNASAKIRYGLAEVARLKQKPLPADKVALLLKTVLFDVDPMRTPVSPDLREIVIERILTAIEPHLGQESIVFDDWFWGRHNSFIKQIAKQKKSPRGELDPEIVEQVLLELGWDAFVHAWAYDMMKAMPDALSDSERHAFEMLYLPRQEFGNIPLILLAEKLQFADPVLEDIINNPEEDQPVQALYRLLQFYSAMVSNRREADIRIKKVAEQSRKRLRKETGQEHSLDSESAPPPAASSDEQDEIEGRDVLQAVYQEVATIKHVTCECVRPKWSVKPEAIEDSADFQLTFCCKKCHVTKVEVLSIEELRRIQERLK